MSTIGPAGVTALVSRGTVEPIPFEDIFEGSHGQVLNGMFGVPKLDKPVTEKKRLALRLIMNFVPINAYLLAHLGELRTLPWTGQWSTFVVGDNQVFTLYGEDQTAFFFFYELPKAWRPRAFSRHTPRCCFRCDNKGKVFFTAHVMPLGWLLVVSAMQDIGSRLALSPPPLGASIVCSSRSPRRPRIPC